MASIISYTKSAIDTLLGGKLSKTGDTLTGDLTATGGAKFRGGSTDTVEQASLEQLHGGQVIGSISNRYGFLTVGSKTPSEGVAILNDADSGVWMDTEGRFSFDMQPRFPYTPGEDPNFDLGIKAMVAQTLDGGASGHFLGRNQYLPGRPLATTQQLIAITAFNAWVSIFRVTDPAGRAAPDLYYSVSTAGSQGSNARAGIYTWNWSTMTASLRNDYGESSIEGPGNKAIAKPVGMTTLAPGDYAAIIVPQSNVTLRMLQVHDLLYGAQSGSGLFDPNADRANPAFVKNLGSYPAAMPSSIVYTTAYTHVGAKAALTWGVLV